MIILERLLSLSGFCEIERVGNFNIFPDDYDTSTLSFINIPISLNIITRPCVTANTLTDGFYMRHFGSSYISIPIEEYPEYDVNLKEFYIVTTDNNNSNNNSGNTNSTNINSSNSSNLPTYRKYNNWTV